ncbi:MAG: hypothetical protein EPO29_07615 [Betaproteobacteria bacterium]|nr:MAG: hypothetical protein EPO29_07615 [Betaproteobacteria bacterium]
MSLSLDQSLCAVENPSLYEERARLAPSDRELSLLLRLSFGRELETFDLDELELARLVFAQVALMAGAALSADSEVFVGAERLWGDMQGRIGKQEHTLAKRFLQLLAQDEMHTESERRLLTKLAEALEERRPHHSGLAS